VDLLDHQVDRWVLEDLLPDRLYPVFLEDLYFLDDQFDLEVLYFLVCLFDLEDLYYLDVRFGLEDLYYLEDLFDLEFQFDP
jgi:hypothetical protein